MRLSEASARARFAAVHRAVLATVADDGAPHLVPVTFVVDGDRIHTAVDHKPKSTTALRRLRNIAADPRVALLVDHYDDDWDALWWVRADGHATVTADADGMRHPLGLLVDRYEQYRTHRPAGPVITIRVDRWTGWASTGSDARDDADGE